MPEPHQPDTTNEAEVNASRRGLMQSTLLVAGATQLPAAVAAPRPGSAPPLVPPRPVTLNINGCSHRLVPEPRVTLLDARANSWA